MKKIGLFFFGLLIVIIASILYYLVHQAKYPFISLEKGENNSVLVYLHRKPDSNYSSFKIGLAYEPEKLRIKSIAVNPEITTLAEPRSGDINNLQGIIKIGGGFKKTLPPDISLLLATISFDARQNNIVTPISFISNQDQLNIVTIASGLKVDTIHLRYEYSPLLITE